MQPAPPAGLPEGAAGFGVAGEGGDRVAEEGADVDVGAVGADGDDVGAEQRPAAGAAGHRQDRDAAGAVGGSWRSAPVLRLRLKLVTELEAREVT